MLEVEGLVRSFGDVRALRGVSFSVPPGVVVGFLGPNGAGKTTTMRAIMGITEVDEGEVRFCGQRVDAAARRRFGYMPEERGLYPRMELREQLVYFARLTGLDRLWAEASTDHMLERLGLTERARSRVSELSHGNQQRAQLAAALIHSPDLLILDEPFSGLDPVAVRNLGDLLAERAEEGACVLFSSHQLDLVEDLCQRVVMLNAGRVVLEGQVRAIRRDSGGRRVRVAIGGDETGDWSDRLPGVAVIRNSRGVVTFALESGGDPRRVFEAAEKIGPVTEFSLEPPRLSEIFHQAVAS